MAESALLNNQSGEVKRPALTVQMPVYNGQEYLAETIESILNQTLSDFEFLILDDGSTDDSLEILKRYAAQDSRISIITRENKGLGITQHELIQHAKGEFIAQTDQDDISLPNRLELQFNFLKENPNVVAVGGAYQLIDGAGRYLTTLPQPISNEEIQSLILEGHCALIHPGSMMRSKQMKISGGYDNSFNLALDLDLWLRLGEIGELANLSEVVLKYRLHGKSASEIMGKNQRNEARKACERAWKRRNITCQFTAHFDWRPSTDKASQHSFMLKYGWWAWNRCQRKTAAFYGWQAIKVKPLSIAGWKLLIVSLVKPLRGIL